MSSLLNNLEPKEVLYYFEKISQIPRGSGNEKAIADYLCSFAKDHNLNYSRDTYNNVFITKSSTNNSNATVLLQGHTDMVCDKLDSVNHNFAKDGIELIVNGNILSANGTTLGADDGAAVAMMLAILASNDINHPNLECLFTTNEEVGLDGIRNFDASLIHATDMINLDSEEEGIVTVACAGGNTTTFTLPIEREKAFTDSCIKVSLRGLAGGHSGADIDKNRANAIKLMGRILHIANENNTINLIDIKGGTKSNAIPREASFSFISSDTYLVRQKIEAEIEKIKEELDEIDYNFEVLFTVEKNDENVISKDSTKWIISLISDIPYGIINMSETIPGLVETSTNLGVIRTNTDNIEIISSTRSSISEKIDIAINNLNIIAQNNYSKIEHYSRYPGWDATKGSKLQDIYVSTYKETTGKEPIIAGIHAGLECGLLSEKLPDLNMISIGPNLFGVHSPDEKMEIDSLDRTYTLLKSMLEKM